MLHRPLFLALAILAAPAYAAQDPTALSFAQRRALVAADAACGLLEPGPRAALAVMTAQSRSALVRSGWQAAEIADLEGRAIRAGQSHECGAPALVAAAASARAGYEGWRKLSVVTFPGEAARWTARRTPDPDGWLFWQEAPGGAGARLGLRESDGGPQFVFAVRDALRASGARIRMRDLRLAPQPGFDAPGRARARLADRAPMAIESTAVLAAERRIEPAQRDRPAQTAFAFDRAALDRLTALDAREAVRIELPLPDGTVRTYDIEVGDVAAARAFATMP